MLIDKNDKGNKTLSCLEMFLIILSFLLIINYFHNISYRKCIFHNHSM